MDINPTYTIDLESGALSLNDAFYRTFGYDQQEKTDTMEWWISHVHPIDAMLLNEAMNQLLDPHKTSWIVAYRFRKADGDYVVVTDHATVQRDYTGEATHLTGILTT
jgi:PAS domain S-box-containing protein